MKPSQLDQAARDTVRLMLEGNSLTESLHIACGPYPDRKTKEAVKRFMIYEAKWIDNSWHLTDKARDEVEALGA